MTLPAVTFIHPCNNHGVRTIAEGTSAEAQLEVKRSRFIALVEPALSEDEARAVVHREKSKYPDARHHCSAFVLESTGATPDTHFSDDGEPSGTAGAPMLAALQSAELVNVVAVVTRYFGGTLLGTGGLVRAYSGAVQAALSEARIVEIKTLPCFCVTVDPALAGRIEAEVRRRDWTVRTVQWGREVELEFTVPPDEAEAVSGILAGVLRKEPPLRRLPDVRAEI